MLNTFTWRSVELSTLTLLWYSVHSRYYATDHFWILFIISCWSTLAFIFFSCQIQNSIFPSFLPVFISPLCLWFSKCWCPSEINSSIVKRIWFLGLRELRVIESLLGLLSVLCVSLHKLPGSLSNASFNIAYKCFQRCITQVLGIQCHHSVFLIRCLLILKCRNYRRHVLL